MSIIGKQYMGRVNLAGEAQAVDNNPTTVLTRDAVTGDVKLTPVSFFPSDADVDGLNLAVNQAAATLMLRNAANNVLSTVNLGFLNNEGTTFFYNSTTEELELRNDDGEVLSSIPVSAFVSNLIQSVNFNSGTPYRLEFKDASGDVVDFVDINVSNVQGAAVDADVLHKTGNETKTGNLSIIGDLGIANNRAIGVGDGLYLFYSSATQKTMLNRPSDDLNFMTFNAATGNVLVGSSTDTGEKLQVTGRVNIDLYDLPNSTPGVTIYTKAAPASPQALRVVNKDTNELLFFVSKNGLVSSRFFEVIEYIKTPKAIIRPVGEPDTGEALQVSGDGIISGGLKVANTPTNPTDVVRLQDLSTPVANSTFTPTATPSYAAGKLEYDSNTESLVFYNNDSSVALNIGQESWIRVRNDSGSSIPNGSAVYISGTHASGIPQIALASASSLATSIVAGLTTETIPNNAVGYVTSLGLVNNINTSAFAAGAILFLSATTPGALTTTVPTAPNYRYRVGLVTKSNATTGTIHVTPSIAVMDRLSASAVLDFPSTSAGTSSELTITLTGAADGDVIMLGVPNASTNPNSCYTARVSAANTVTVRFNNYSNATINPASGTFKVSIFK